MIQSIEYYKIALLFILSIFISCTKDKILDTKEPVTKIISVEQNVCNYSDTCPVNFKECTSPIGFLTTNKSPWIVDPVFNPNNNDELIFFKWETQNNLNYYYSLVKLQISTRITTTISTNVNIAGTEAYWSKDGNIYFNGDDQRIYKYSPTENRTSPLNLPIGDVCPRIVENIFFTISGNSNYPYTYYKSDLNGKRLDSIYGPPNYCCDLSSDFKFAYSDTGTLGFNVVMMTYSNNIRNKKILTYFSDANQNLSVLDINWHPNNEDLFFLKPGELYKVNIKTKKLSLVKLACNAGRMMNNFTISPDGKKIVIAYQIPKQLNPQNPCNITFYSYLGIMDIDGCNERVLYKPDYQP